MTTTELLDKAGLVMVPREPTVAMLAAAVGETELSYRGQAEKHYRHMWRLMVRAALETKPT